MDGVNVSPRLECQVGATAVGKHRLGQRDQGCGEQVRTGGFRKKPVDILRKGSNWGSCGCKGPEAGVTLTHRKNKVEPVWA